MSVFLRSVRCLLVIANAAPSSLILSTMKMEVTRYSEKSVITRPTRRHIPEDGILHSHRRESLKSYMATTFTSEADSKVFWRWCRHSALPSCFTLSSGILKKARETQRFGNWICFRPQVSRRETSILLVRLQRAICTAGMQPCTLPLGNQNAWEVRRRG
jgi:hypothetical protein